MLNDTGKQEKEVQAKERRGTYVLLKDPQVENTENEEMVQKNKNIDKDKRNRRGTFLVPTAPPPAPRHKKTVSNIPILEGRTKSGGENETKREPDQDRRGTYFVPKPVTPYIEVENIEDIEADSLLVSLTDDDSQGPEIRPQYKIKEPFHQETTKDSVKNDALQISAVPTAPSPGSQPGDSTVLEPQDMELTEALTINWSRFSAPEPDFLRKVSPGPTAVTIPAVLNTTVTIEKTRNRQKIPTPECHATTEQVAPCVLAAESDFEEEKHQVRERRKSTKTSRTSKTMGNKEEDKYVKENSIDSNVTSTEKIEISVRKDEMFKETITEPNRNPAFEPEIEAISVREETEINKQEKVRRSKKFRLMKTLDDTLGPVDAEGVICEVAASEVSIRKTSYKLSIFIPKRTVSYYIQILEYIY